MMKYSDSILLCVFEDSDFVWTKRNRDIIQKLNKKHCVPESKLELSDVLAG